MTEDISKLVGYVVLGDETLVLPKLVAEVVVGVDDAEDVTKLVVYVVTGPPPVEGILRVLTWTFTLDGHEFLVIQLRDATLVYDFLVDKWYTWGSGTDGGNWQAALGQNWNANLGAIMSTLGGAGQSDVVCGDQDTGTLYFLDPDLAEDYTADGDPGQQFDRIITGQVTLRGRDYLDCPCVELTGSTGNYSGDISDFSVTLLTSDDKGHTYVSAGTLEPVVGVYDYTLAWRSLGSFTGPGRLFRIIDYGALKRIDGIDMGEDDESAPLGN